MIILFSNEFWIATLFIFQFLLVVILFVQAKKINRLKFVAKENNRQEEDAHAERRHASNSATDIIKMLEPLMRESKKTAIAFDEQVKEKKRLLKALNHALDDRIININLLLSRAETQQNKLLEQLNKPSPVSLAAPALNPDASSSAVLDQQHRIIELYEQRFSPDDIARQLSVPKGEVTMVIDLKKKFLEMEQRHS